MEARAASLLEECVICLAPDCLSLDMISCQAGCRFCKSCLISPKGMGVVMCLGSCHLEMEVNQMQRMLLSNSGSTGRQWS